ncbi:hypothetical protein GO986_02390 [Deinococcus sp. HMF7620]|uniref:Uncharacterized protein n=1 Tax=Deinococcus arboris TaxID=2682977 RepID=A0A7C9HWJ5_9DEIO|nr:hypothetical protein [Deinococcus arboris]MVN85608.1 hypothetical protein [Deinococcus arboris]
MSDAVTFPAPGRIPYPGGCVLEPAPHALDWLLNWPADVQVGATLHPATPVFPLLRELLRDPATYGTTLAAAEAAAERFLMLAGQALEAEGGQRAWLERELRR